LTSTIRDSGGSFWLTVIGSAKSWRKGSAATMYCGALTVFTEPKSRRVSPGANDRAGVDAGGEERNRHAAAPAAPARTTQSAPINAQRPRPAGLLAGSLGRVGRASPSRIWRMMSVR